MLSSPVTVASAGAASTEPVLSPEDQTFVDKRGGWEGATIASSI